jgi:hypothetical protein
MTYKREKGIKTIKLPAINNIKNQIFIPNHITFKTTQVHLGGWIKINPDLYQNEIDHCINKAIRNIKIRISAIAKTTGLYHQQSIVVIDTSVLERGHKKKCYQFVNVDLTLFNRINIYDKKKVIQTIRPLIEDIIKNDINDDDVFNFIKKEKGSKQYE